MVKIANKLFDVQFENLFKIVSFSMHFNGSHPEIMKNKSWALKLISLNGLYTLIFSYFVFSIVYYDVQNDDFTKACANATLCLVYIVGMFMYVTSLHFVESFKSIIKKIDKDYETATNFPIDEQELLFSYVEKGKSVAKLWLGFSFCTAALFPVKSVVLMIYYSIVDEFKFVHLYDLTYPTAVEEAKNTLSVFLVLYIILLYYDLYGFFLYLGFVPLGPIFMLHACGQIQLVRKRLMNIFKKSRSKTEQVKHLKDVIRNLQNIYRFVEEIQRSFQLLYELTSKAIAIVIPVTLYQIIESFRNGALEVEFISIVLAAVTLVSIPCYYSDMLLESGEQMRLAVYMCGWEDHWDRNTYNLIKLLLLRTSRPIVVRTMFRPVCLSALSEVFHQSYAIFNVLNAAIK